MYYINQIIPTVQGEGPLVGHPSLLIRFEGCNLKCPFCDSKYSISQKKNHQYEFADIERMIYENLYKYPNIKHLMITGGEPFIQQELINLLISNFKSIFDIIEFETNGFDIANKFILDSADNKQIQLNISPKLDINCYVSEYEMSINKLIFMYNELYEKLSFYHVNFIYKLIYCEKYKNDIINFCLSIEDKSKLFFMPMTPSLNSENFKKHYKHNCLDTIEFCKSYGYRYSPRIHVDVFEKDTSEISK